MQPDREFYPDIFLPEDLAIMSCAYRGVMAQASCANVDPHDVARIALRFYRMGLVDEMKLGEATEKAARNLTGYIPG